MNRKINILIVSFLFIFVVGCTKVCPSGYKYSDGQCYTYENVEADIEYYCARGGELDGKNCIITEEYDCSQAKDQKICTNTTSYPANKEYNCPTGYDLNGEKCSKIKYYNK